MCGGQEIELNMGAIKQLGKNTFLIFIGNIGAKFITFIMFPFYTRWLSPEDYGTTDIIFVYSSLLLGLTTCCIADAIFVFPRNVNIQKQRSYFTTSLLFFVISILITGFIFFLIDFIAKSIGSSNSFTRYIWWVYAIIIATFLQNLFQQFCRSLDKIIFYSISGLILAFFTALFSFLLIPQHGILGYLISMIASLFLSSVCIFFPAKLYTYIRFDLFSKPLLKEMLQYSCPLIPNTLMWWIINSLNRPFLENFVGLGGIGILAVAQKIPNMVSVVFNVFSSAWQISVLDEFTKSGFNKYFNNVMSILMLLITAIIIIFCPFSDFLMKIIVGEDFYEASTYVPTLTITFFFLSLNTIVSPIFSAYKTSKYFFYTSIYGAVASLISYLIFIPIWGIWGAVLGICLSQATMTLARLKYATQYISILNKKLYIIYSISIIIIVFTSTYPLQPVAKYGAPILLMIIIITSFFSINKKEICKHLKVKF